MRTIRPFVLLLCAAVAALAAVSSRPASAEKPNMSPQALRNVATHVVVGEVKAICSRVVREGGWEVRKFVAEVAVEDVEKGDGVAKGSLAYVRYWQTWWLGRPNEIPPGTVGHRGVPKEGDRVRIYLARNAYDGFTDENKDGGFNVIGANGFEGPLPLAPTGPALSGWLPARDNLKIGVRIYEGVGDQKKPYGVVIRFVGQNMRVIIRYTGGEMEGVEDSVELSAPWWARLFVRLDDATLKWPRAGSAEARALRVTLQDRGGAVLLEGDVSSSIGPRLRARAPPRSIPRGRTRPVAAHHARPGLRRPTSIMCALASTTVG